MDVASLQRKIDELTWYHEFDFGNGLRTQSRAAEPQGHHRIWNFIQTNLDRIDFRGKTVLDIGCWDGYWSFYAERRAARVLATDDHSQNWAGSRAIHLAKELLHSSIEINTNVSVYELSSLGRTFDIVLYLGVFYHLFDPFYALAQIRRCCHSQSLMAMEGSVAAALGSGQVYYDFTDHNAEFLPHPQVVQQFSRAAYFQETNCEFLDPLPVAGSERLGFRWRLGMCLDALSGSRARVRRRTDIALPPTSARRMFTTCVPFEGHNEIHYYKPPFGLHCYDPRFQDNNGGRAA